MILKFLLRKNVERHFIDKSHVRYLRGDYTKLGIVRALQSNNCPLCIEHIKKLKISSYCGGEIPDDTYDMIRKLRDNKYDKDRIHVISNINKESATSIVLHELVEVKLVIRNGIATIYETWD